jgi:hypothetical protein
VIDRQFAGAVVAAANVTAAVGSQRAEIRLWRGAYRHAADDFLNLP